MPLRLEGATCEQARADLAASTQEAIVDVLARKSMAALDRDRPVAPGGRRRRRRQRACCASALMGECEKRQARVFFPELALCTDNGAMIALAAAMRLQRGIAALSIGLCVRRAAALAADGHEPRAAEAG